MLSLDSSTGVAFASTQDEPLVFVKDTATTEIYTILFVGSVRCVQETVLEDAVDNLTDAWNDLSPDMQENIVQWTLMAGAAGPVIKIFGSVAGGLGAILKLIPSVTAGLGASGVAGALGGVAPAATGAGGAAALFTNPWVLGIAAVAWAAVGVGTAIYDEMHKEDQAHEDAIDATKGKYEEWYNAVIDGAKPVVESQQQIQGSVKNTGCLLYTSPSPRDRQKSRMPSSA
eukprot:TRINITY_DN23461_c0_g1_i1.p1 TRINITY_DN23461_c0_g1~~TRINITY_DN23461_c0_g1_i1.p1  ORF type:complete len:229 (+),score=39.77 TRINITY_DN23461_c0_g1_i1:3-689(+)